MTLKVTLIGCTLLLLVGCASNPPGPPTNWKVLKGKDAMTDAKICRITGNPSARYIFSAGRSMFRIAPFVEKAGNSLVAGFTAMFPEIGAAPSGAEFFAVEYRFDGGAPQQVAGLPNHTLFVTDAKRFTSLMSTSNKIVYRVNAASVVEMSLDGIKDRLTECEIATS